MTAILSPAMNMEPAEAVRPLTTPRFLAEAEELAAALRERDPWQLESLLGVNPQIALRAWGDYQAFGSTGLPAARSFRGLAYRHLDAKSFTEADGEFAAEHLRLLSALYGLLQPDDKISPYRLDFVCRFGKNGAEGKSLYSYWGQKVCRALFEETDTVINLCSGEYERLVAPHLQRGNRMITCRFLVRRGTKLRATATAAKMARGQMARFLIKNRAAEPKELESFDWMGYRFTPQMSGQDRMTFVQLDEGPL